uniref:(California timema) hypothetical protein n=1 Tax=Timema californicum TaxID=61474 RepID=A0A7R9P7W5_TIMCA|nr:unnamed protein product [Timema californicum]
MVKKSRSFIEDQLLRNRKTFLYVLQENCEVKVRYPHLFSELRHSSNSRMRESAVQNNRISEPDVRCYPPTARCYASVDCLHTFVKTTVSSLVMTKSCEYNAIMDQEIDEYFESALKLTKEAGKIIVEGLHSIKTISSKTSTSDIVTNYDLKVEEKLFKGLAALYPAHRQVFTVRKHDKTTEQLPYVDEDSAKIRGYRVSYGHHKEPSGHLSQYSRLELLIYADEAEFDTDTDPLLHRKIWKHREKNLRPLDLQPGTLTTRPQFIGEEDQFIKGTSIVLTDSPTWIIDPIDGTQNFVHSLHFVYISIALSINKQVVLGIAYNPILDILFTAKKGQGAFLNSQPIHVSKVTKMSKALVGANLINFNPGNELEECIFNRIKYITASSQSAPDLDSNLNPPIIGGIFQCESSVLDHVANETGGPFELAKERILCAATIELANELLQVVQKFDSSIPNPIHKGP